MKVLNGPIFATSCRHMKIQKRSDAPDAERFRQSSRGMTISNGKQMPELLSARSDELELAEQVQPVCMED